MNDDGAAPMLRPAPAPASAVAATVPFSLFDGDLLRVFYAKLGLGNGVPFVILKRCVFAFVVTWVPIALLAWRQGLVDSAVTPTNFFADFAAYVQFMVGLPLFLFAEVIVDASTREAAGQLVRCRIVDSRDASRLERINAVLQRWRTSWVPEALCIVLAYAISLAILVPQFGSEPLPTWHAQGDENSRRLTAAGVWAFFVSLPIINYIWLRFGWKILMWTFYLYHVAHVRLDLHPTHPDLTGGIGFISEAQGRFALFILAYGISNVAAPVGYQIAVLNYDLSFMPVWGPMVGFTIGAPLLFLLPLFMFTKQLFRCKKRALGAYRERISDLSGEVERNWLYTARKAHFDAPEFRELSEFATLGAMFDRIERMRVVPFDLRSVSQLLVSNCNIQR